MSAAIATPQLCLLTRRQVEVKCGMSRTSIYRRMEAGTFPRPIKDPDTGAVRWLAHEIDAWILPRIQARDSRMGRCMGREKGNPVND